MTQPGTCRGQPGPPPRGLHTAAELEHHTSGARETSLCVASGKAENAPEEASWAAQHPERGGQGAEGGRRDGGDACNRGRDGGGGEETSGDGSGQESTKRILHTVLWAYLGRRAFVVWPARWPVKWRTSDSP